MKRKYIKTALQRLQEEIEFSINKRMRSTQDFQYLSLSIYKRTNSMLSVSTLKRFFGVIAAETNPSENTLDILSQFIGYTNYADFISKKDNRRKLSSFSYSSKVVMSQDLKPGSKIQVSWKPNRHCVFRFIGGDRFLIEESVNSKLKVNATFSCIVFAERLCALLTDYHNDEKITPCYVIGYNGGLTNIVIIENNF